MYKKIIEHCVREDDETYHARSKSGEVMSSHKLADFTYDPVKYKMEIDGLMPDVDSSAFKFGRAAHCYILEGQDAFNSIYTVGGAINPKTGKSFGSTTKKQLDFEEEHNTQVITDDEFYRITSMDLSIRDHVLCNEVLKEGEAELVLRATIEDVPCQIKMDKIVVDGLSDLKTTKDLESFEYDAKKFGYSFQMAFYRMVIRAATGIAVPCYLVAVEKEAPYKAGLFKIEELLLEDRELQIRAQLRKYKICKDTNDFPSNYKDMRTLTD